MENINTLHNLLSSIFNRLHYPKAGTNLCYLALKVLLAFTSNSKLSGSSRLPIYGYFACVTSIHQFVGFLLKFD